MKVWKRLSYAAVERLPATLGAKMLKYGFLSASCCIGFKNCKMTGRWGVVDGGVQPGGRWNGEVPVEEDGALVGERDRLVGEMWSLAMARCKQYRSR